MKTTDTQQRALDLRAPADAAGGAPASRGAKLTLTNALVTASIVVGVILAVPIVLGLLIRPARATEVVAQYHLAVEEVPWQCVGSLSAPGDRRPPP